MIMTQIAGLLLRQPVKPPTPWPVSISGDIAALSGAMLAVSLTIISLTPTVAGLAEARGGRYFSLIRVRQKIARKIDALNISLACFALATGLGLWTKAADISITGIIAIIPFSIGMVVIVWSGWGISGTAKDLLMRRGDG